MGKQICPDCLQMLDDDIQVCPFCGCELYEEIVFDEDDDITSQDWEDMARQGRRDHLRSILIRLAVWVGSTVLVWLLSGFDKTFLPMALLIGVLISSVYVLIEPAIGLGSRFKAIRTTTDTQTDTVVSEEQVNYGWVGAAIGIAIVLGVCYFLSTLSAKLPSFVIVDEVAMVVVLLLVPLYRNLKDVQGFLCWNAVLASAKKQGSTENDTTTEDVYDQKNEAHARFNKRLLIVAGVALAVLVLLQSVQVMILSGIAESSYDAVAVIEQYQEQEDVLKLVASVDTQKLSEPTETTMSAFDTKCTELVEAPFVMDGVVGKTTLRVVSEYAMFKGWSGDVYAETYQVTDVNLKDRVFEGEAVWTNTEDESEDAFVRVTIQEAMLSSETVIGTVAVYKTDKQTVIFTDTISGSVYVSDDDNQAHLSVVFDSVNNNAFFGGAENVHLSLSPVELELDAYGAIKGTLNCIK